MTPVISSPVLAMLIIIAVCMCTVCHSASVHAPTSRNQAEEELHPERSGSRQKRDETLDQPPPEIAFSIGGSGSPISQHHVTGHEGKRTLCPWTMQHNMDENRWPQVIPEAKCGECDTCKNILGGRCEPVQRKMFALKKERRNWFSDRKNNYNERSSTYVLKRMYVDITVACVCRIQ